MPSQPQQRTPDHVRGTRSRVSKDEKICKLKSDLKVSKEENTRLKQEIERLRKQQLKQSDDTGMSQSSHRNNNDNATGNSSGNPQQHQLTEQEKKFREAMRAMKKVTISQEKCIRTLRSKAKERRKELRQKDSQILQLEHKTKSLESAARHLTTSRSPDDLQSKLQQLQMDYDNLLQRNNDLEEILDEKEAKMEALQKQRKSLLSPLHASAASNKKHQPMPNGSGRGGTDSDAEESAGSGSLQSISTAQDFDVARLKTELAQKSDKILKLQMDLDVVKDELYQLKQQKRHSTNNATDDFGSNNNAFQSDPFAATPTTTNTNNSNPFFAPQDPFGLGGSSGHQLLPSGDDWTEIDSTTDNESEFGEAGFGATGTGDVQFGESFFSRASVTRDSTKEADFW